MRCPHQGHRKHGKRRPEPKVRGNDEGGDHHHGQQDHAELAERHARDPMAQMGGQHEQAFDQRERHTTDDRTRDDAEHDADRAHGEEQWHERHHGRQHTERDRDQHALNTLDGTRKLPDAAAMGDVDALADHHGIVDQQAERQDESHDRGGIHRVAEHVDEEDGAHERDGNADGHPERQMRP